MKQRYRPQGCGRVGVGLPPDTFLKSQKDQTQNWGVSSLAPG